MDPFYSDQWLTIYEGNSLDVLRSLPTESVHMAITSPPYWGLRDYGLPPVVWDGDPDCDHEWEDLPPVKRSGGTGEKSAIQAAQKGQAAIFESTGGAFCAVCNAWLGQLGLEPTPDLYVKHLVDIFHELRRVLRHDGTFWLNIGDSYAGSGKGAWGSDEARDANRDRVKETYVPTRDESPLAGAVPYGMKPKDLVGIPWMLAFALRNDGWWLRSDIIWAKPNVMPESIMDRPTKSHEYLFLFAKSARYYFDMEAIKEPLVSTEAEYLRAGQSVRDNHAFGEVGGRPLGDKSFATMPTGRNKRSVWFVASQPYKGAHYAPFPPKLVEPPIMAGTSETGVCGACGAPWVRQVDKDRAFISGSGRSGNNPVGKNSPVQGGGETIDVRRGPIVASETTGWHPSCACCSVHPVGLCLCDPWPTAPDPVPAIVLDPFGGSGTTAMVAQSLSRRAILIDLNGSYLEQQLIRNSHIPLGL